MMSLPNLKQRELYLFCFFILGLFPICPFAVKPYLLVPLLILAIFRFTKGNLKVFDWKYTILNSSIFLIFFLSLLYTSDVNQGTKQIIRLLPLLTIPVSFSLVPYNYYNEGVRLFLRVFCYGCGIFCFIIFFYVVWLDKHDDLGYIYSHITFELWGYREHPIYISLYLGVALIILTSIGKKNFMDWGLIIIIIFTLLFLTRKGNLISLVIVLLFNLITWRKKVPVKKVIRYGLILFIILAIVLFTFDNHIINRFKELFLLKEWYSPKSSTGIRNIVLRTGIELSMDRPVFGYGIGGVQDYINERLISNGYKDLTVIHQYNAHNQYLQITLTAGLLGLVTFLSILFLNLKKLRYGKTTLGFLIFCYLLLCFSFESILERQNGIIVSAVFINLFTFMQNENHNHKP